MKFILWTLVWFLAGDSHLHLICIRDGYAGYRAYKEKINVPVRGFVALIQLFLWIYLYIRFVQ